MLFYQVRAHINVAGAPLNDSRTAQRSFSMPFSEKSEQFFERNREQSFVFCSNIVEKKGVFGIALKTPEDPNLVFCDYMRQLAIEVDSYELEEVTLKLFGMMMGSAERNGYIDEADRVFTAFDISGVVGRFARIDYGERLIKPASKETLLNTAAEYLLSDTLRPEIERILLGRKQNIKGHPVHYMVTVNDPNARNIALQILFSALYSAGRIKSRRFCYVDYDADSSHPGAVHEALYKSCTDGAVVIRYSGTNDEDGNFSLGSEEVINALCDVAAKYRSEVLTVICIPASETKIKNHFLYGLENMSFIEIHESPAFGEAAKQYLKERAKKLKIRADKRLYAPVTAEGKGFTVAELNRIFDTWYDKKLRCEAYPQYSTAETVRRVIQKERVKGSAYSCLESMTGLTEAKRVIDQALDFYKAQKLFADRNISTVRPSMHMVFTGNPGTAKTTVARLFARIMKDNALLSEGKFVEVGRADLVGKYVGHTAPLVRQAFKSAKGGVLFIDEAYSLVEGKNGLFGDEAINTIVQEMENHRDDTVVIFAGYPKEMEEFLNRNPGLRSRIAFHVPFDDYSASELCEIASFIARENGLLVSESALGRLEDIFARVVGKEGFGNGRFVRNVIEQANMRLTSRILKMDVDTVSDSDLITLCAEDIEVPPALRSDAESRKIGFC